MTHSNSRRQSVSFCAVSPSPIPSERHKEDQASPVHTERNPQLRELKSFIVSGQHACPSPWRKKFIHSIFRTVCCTKESLEQNKSASVLVQRILPWRTSSQQRSSNQWTSEPIKGISKAQGTFKERSRNFLKGSFLSYRAIYRIPLKYNPLPGETAEEL